MFKITIVFIALASIVLACSIPKVLEHNRLTKTQRDYWEACFEQDRLNNNQFCTDLYVNN